MDLKFSYWKLHVKKIDFGHPRQSGINVGGVKEEELVILKDLYQ